jgi:hypothetical protein
MASDVARFGTVSIWRAVSTRLESTSGSVRQASRTATYPRRLYYDTAIQSNHSVFSVQLADAGHIVTEVIGSGSLGFRRQIRNLKRAGS